MAAPRHWVLKRSGGARFDRHFSLLAEVAAYPLGDLVDIVFLPKPGRGSVLLGFCARSFEYGAVAGGVMLRSGNVATFGLRRPGPAKKQCTTKGSKRKRPKP